MPALLALALSLLAVVPLPADSSRGDSGQRINESALDADEILWLARCIYSESDRPDEQRLVAWVVRNRVETSFRGDTYREVVLEERQFSAFNDPTPRRDRIVELTAADQDPGWQKALAIAREVYRAPPSSRPFPVTTRHFYSPISMKNRAVPQWAVEKTPLSLASFDVDPERFRFFDGIDEGADDAVAASDPIRERHDAVVSQIRRARRTPRLSGRIERPVPPQPPRRTSR